MPLFIVQEAFQTYDLEVATLHANDLGHNWIGIFPFRVFPGDVSLFPDPETGPHFLFYGPEVRPHLLLG